MLGGRTLCKATRGLGFGEHVPGANQPGDLRHFRRWPLERRGKRGVASETLLDPLIKAGRVGGEEQGEDKAHGESLGKR